MAPTNPFAHIVFFTLTEPTPENVAALVEGCRAHLTGHEGTLHFSTGRRAEEYARDVNDGEFHVSLHLVFRDASAHDAYQDHPRHHAFIETYQHLWAQVRVFDSHVAAAVGDNE